MLCSCCRWTLTSLMTPWSSTWTFTAFNPLQLHFTHHRKSFVVIIVIIIYIPVCRGCAGDTQMHAHTRANNLFFSPIIKWVQIKSIPYRTSLDFGKACVKYTCSHSCEHQPWIRVPMSQCEAPKLNKVRSLYFFHLFWKGLSAFFCSTHIKNEIICVVSVRWAKNSVFL